MMAIFQISVQCMCLRHVRLKQKGIPCKQCGCLIHRKCAKFDQDTLRHIKKNINSWNCSTCKALQFPFMNLTDFEINRLIFNSNFNCICKEISHENVLENGMTDDFIENLNLPQLQLNEFFFIQVIIQVIIQLT